MSDVQYNWHVAVDAVVAGTDMVLHVPDNSAFTVQVCDAPDSLDAFPRNCREHTINKEHL